MLDALRQITIVGTGLLGASLGLALKERGFSGKIVGVGRRLTTVNRARQLGALDEASTDLAQAVEHSDLLILAAPLGQFEPIFQSLAACEHHGLVITDVGSTKSQVCALARRYLLAPGQFVGSHPMAGSEQQGPDAASAQLFHGKPCILTPESDTNGDAVKLVRELWQTLGMRVLAMSPGEHDEQVALISHLPHLVAVVLVDLAARYAAMDVASTGFADTTRVASGDANIWADVFASNRQALVQAIDEMTGELAKARQMIADNRHDETLAWLRKSKAVRDAWMSGKTGNG